MAGSRPAFARLDRPAVSRGCPPGGLPTAEAFPERFYVGVARTLTAGDEARLLQAERPASLPTLTPSLQLTSLASCRVGAGVCSLG